MIVSNGQLTRYLSELSEHSLPDVRRSKLQQIAAALKAQLSVHSTVQLVWVCNHNSRRSQIAEAWSQVLFGKQDGLQIASGGELASEVHPNAVRALNAAGFEFEQVSNGFRFASVDITFKLSSKTLQQLPDSNARFAISVCTDTDAQCPFVPGAVARFSLPFTDPKFSDESATASAVYAETCRDIARHVQLLQQYTGPFNTL